MERKNVAELMDKIDSKQEPLEEKIASSLAIKGVDMNISVEDIINCIHDGRKNSKSEKK
jgi:hypothetical protein